MRSIHWSSFVGLFLFQCCLTPYPAASDDCGEDKFYKKIESLMEASVKPDISWFEEERISRALTGLIDSSTAEGKVTVLKSLIGFKMKWSRVAIRCLSDRNSYVRLSAARALVENGDLPLGRWLLQLREITPIDARCYYPKDDIHDITRLVNLETAYVRHRFFPQSHKCLSRFVKSASEILHLVEIGHVYMPGEQSLPGPDDVSYYEVFAMLNMLAESPADETYRLISDFSTEHVDLSEIALERLDAGAVIRGYSLKRYADLWSKERVHFPDNYRMRFLRYRKSFQESNWRECVTEENFFLGY